MLPAGSNDSSQFPDWLGSPTKMIKTSDKSILVTGGAGYIGSQACKALAAAGLVPVVFDSLERGHREAVRWGPLEVGNLADRARIDEVLRIHQPAGVLHFAAYAYVGESTANPGMYYRNNVAGSLNLLEALVAAGSPPVVFSSTCATYGIPLTETIREDHPQAPINPYGASKLMVERLLLDFDAAHGLRSATLRYFNAAGADPEGDLGELHDPEPHLIPLVLDAALGRRDAVSIFGTDYPTPDGTCIRDYIHVADLAEAHVLALRHLLSGGDSLRLNLANGSGYSVREVISTAQRIAGRPVPTHLAVRRSGDPPRLVGDASEAARILGWKPAFGSLDVIIEHAWKWHLKRFGG